MYLGEIISALKIYISSIKPQNRLEAFDKKIESVTTRYRLPNIYSYNDLVPKCIKNELNKLYMDMTNLYFRKRIFSVTSHQFETTLG